MQKPALVIESDQQVADLLLQHLRTAVASRVDHAADGETGVSMAESFKYGLICLELAVPKLGGPELCKALRAARRESRLLAVTARADAMPALLGTETGIDDYLFKPIVPRELTRKAEALLTRQRDVADFPTLVDMDVGALSFRPSTRSIVVEGKNVSNLSLAEFDIVYFLARNAGVSFSEQEILASLWSLYSPVGFKNLGIDLRLLRMKLRGLLTGRRYLVLAAGGRIQLNAEGGA